MFLAQTCAEAGTPATIELPEGGISMQHGEDRRDFSGTHSVVRARQPYPYDNQFARITILANGIFWETEIHLLHHTLWFSPTIVEALIDRLLGIRAESSELLQVQRLLDQERTKRLALEDELTELQREREGERVARLATEATAKPSHLLVISALLELLKAPVKHSRPNGIPQSAVIESILSGFPFRGRSKRNLENIFSEANTARKEAE